jgi:molecular chaperone HtpG
VTKGDLDLGELADKEESEKEKQAETELKDLIERMQKSLDEKVKQVRVSHRLTSSPACLVADSADMGGNMERILKEAGHDVGATRKILEINPDHPLVSRLNKESAGERFDDWSNILFDQALLAEGGQLADPAGFVRRLNELLLEIGTSQ